MFGLYATTGRAVSFVAPTLVGVFSTLAGDRAGIAGILVVLAAGLVAPFDQRRLHACRLQPDGEREATEPCADNDCRLHACLPIKARIARPTGTGGLPINTRA